MTIETSAAVLYDGSAGRDARLETLRALRDAGPVSWYSENGSGSWIVTGHEDVRRMNRDWRTFSSASFTVAGAHADKPVIMLESDPPEHTDKRRKVHRLFAPRAIERLNASITTAAENCVTDFLERGGGDAVAGLAARLPARVIGDMLGVPEADQERLQAWSDDRLGVTTGRGEPRRSPADALSDLFDYGFGLVRRLRAKPGDDVMSALIRDPSTPDDQELVEWFRLLVLGGLETTQSLLSGGLLLLLERPHLAEMLAAERAVVPRAVEEMLRWITPVQHHRRRAMSDVEMAGSTIRRGDLVDLWMLSANHDERAFARPESFDITRDPNPHLSFGGGGPHFCLGAYLTRAEAAAFFSAIAQHMGRLSLDGEPAWLPSSHFNALAALPVSVN